jgi:hypothetical protein
MPKLIPHCIFYPNLFRQKRDISLKIDMNKGSGANELVEDANAIEEGTSETLQDEERLQEVCNSQSTSSIFITSVTQPSHLSPSHVTRSAIVLRPKMFQADERPSHASHSARRSGRGAPQPQVTLPRLKDGNRIS